MDDSLSGKVVITPSGEYATIIEDDDLIEEFKADVVCVHLWGQHPIDRKYYHRDDLRFYNSDLGVVSLNPLREELEAARTKVKRYDERMQLTVSLLTAMMTKKLEELGLDRKSATKFFHDAVRQLHEVVEGKEEEKR